MLKILNTCIRPTIEYAVPTYHPMLNKEMCKEIESVQKRASKIIFGWETDYNALVNEKKIESVEERRERLTLNFAQKTSNNPRFAHWFEKRQETDYNLRVVNTYEEYFARTERMKKSPLYYMRRMLNAKLKEETP